LCFGGGEFRKSFGINIQPKHGWKSLHPVCFSPTCFDVRGFDFELLQEQQGAIKAHGFVQAG